jgi:hypothetical protein
MTDVDAVAQALWAADPFKMGDPDMWTGRGDQAHYRHMAQAAIDALGLTEEWRVHGWRVTLSQEAAIKQHLANGGEIHTRLVSSWVRAAPA